MYIYWQLDVMFEELNLPHSRNELKKAIKLLKNNKGAGAGKNINDLFFVHKPYIVLSFWLFSTRCAEEYGIYIEAHVGFREAMGNTDHVISLVTTSSGNSWILKKCHLTLRQ